MIFVRLIMSEFKKIHLHLEHLTVFTRNDALFYISHSFSAIYQPTTLLDKARHFWLAPLLETFWVHIGKPAMPPQPKDVLLD